MAKVKSKLVDSDIELDSDVDLDVDSDSDVDSDVSVADDSDTDADADSEERSAQKTGTALVPHSEMDEESAATHFSITEVLGGGLIGHRFFRRNWGVLATIIVLTIIYVSNRYAADQELIRINDLQKELEEVRYRALTHNSELTMRSRQSYIEEFLRQHGDSTLVARKVPPFVINRAKKK